jgi:hypothetical protein
MKVSNITNNRNNIVANQFIIETDNATYFQSYKSIIVKIEEGEIRNGVSSPDIVTLDPVYWNYSRTTSKHRSTFLNESTKETEKKIKQGVYILANLN